VDTPPIEKIKRSPKERQKIATARQKIAQHYYRDNLITGDPKILTSNQKSPVIKSAGSCENGLKQC